MSTLKVTNIESPSGGGVNAKITDINGGQLSNRNLIINGAMQVSQRGTSFTHTTTSQYTIDRFQAANGSSFNWNSAVISQSSDSPAGFANSLKVDVASTSTPTGSHNACFKYLIEAQDLQQLNFGSTGAAKSFTLSFWVKSNKIGAYSVQVLQSDADKYVLSEYIIFESNTWEKKTLTFVGNDVNVIDNNNGAGFEVRFNLACGPSDMTTPKSTWTAAGGGTIHATASQVNLFDDANNEWYMTGVQLEVGEVATAFEHRSNGDELLRCKRYFVRKDAPGYQRGFNGLGMGTVYTTSVAFAYLNHDVEMRAAPTIDHKTIGDFQTISASGSGAITDITISTSTEQSTLLNIASSAAFHTERMFILWSNTNGAYIDLDAEL